jgi:hypothetical protein
MGDLLSHVPKISICSPAQEAALEIRSLTPHWLESSSLPKVHFFISSKASRPLLSWPCGFVAVFFCFSGVFLRLKPPLDLTAALRAAGNGLLTKVVRAAAKFVLRATRAGEGQRSVNPTARKQQKRGETEGVKQRERKGLSPSTAVYIPFDVFYTYFSTSYIRSTSSTSRLSSGYGDGTAGMLAGRRCGL